jgi:hypothetical protein
LETRINAAFDDIKLEIKAAQAHAVLLREELILRYDIDNDILFLETPPELEIQDYLEEIRQTRRRLYAGKQGELRRDEFYLPSAIDLKAIYVGDEVHTNGSVPVFFGPDGTAEAHRLLLTIPENNSSLAIEIRGLIGLVKEVDPGIFDEEWEEQAKENIPILYADEDFFENGYPDKMPTEEKQGGS